MDHHVTQRRVGVVVGLVLLSLALFAVFAVSVEAMAPLGQSQTSPFSDQTTFVQTGHPNVGPMGSDRTGVIGRTRVPERFPSFTWTAVWVSGTLAVLLIGIAVATAVSDRRARREELAEAPGATVTPMGARGEEREAGRKAA
jgi:ABC-type Fe3+ transport system permease subunit